MPFADIYIDICRRAQQHAELSHFRAACDDLTYAIDQKKGFFLQTTGWLIS